jgi:nitronate monooxygenase
MTPAAARFLALTGARVPVVQAPMAGFAGPELAIAAIGAGAVGSLACATLEPRQVVEQVSAIRAAAQGPINLNFFAHTLGRAPDQARWRAALSPFFAEEQVEASAPPPLRLPFDATMAKAVEAVRPEIVSFHFGLPEASLLDRVRATGARIFGNATNGLEASWLAGAGCDAVIAQGFEAGGHAGHFLIGHRPVGMAALVRQIVRDIGDVLVIAAGGIADEAGAAAAMTLGAAAVQVGTVYLRTPESRASAVHRRALANAGPEDTVFTNLFSGGFARGIRNRLIDALGPVSAAAPPFPYASAALAPLRAKAEAEGRGDYSPLWAGQGLRFAREEPAIDITRRLGAAAIGAHDVHA